MRGSFNIFKEETRKTFALALPMVLGQVGQVSLNFADTAMVGRVGVVPLAGVAFGAGAILLLMVIGANLCSAVHILVARSVGETKQQQTADVLRHGLMVSLLFSVPLGLLFHCNTWVLDLFNQPLDVVEQAKPYTLYTVWSIVPFMVFMCFRNYTEAWNHPWPGFVITVVGVLLNVWWNWVFIFGKWGAPMMGAAGAGFATLLARVVMALLIIAYVVYSKRFVLGWDFKNFLKCKLAYIKEILHLGLPAAGQAVFSLGFLFGTNVMMGWLGANYLAAHQIAFNYCGLFFMVPLGISFAVGIRVGSASGAKDFIKVRNIGLSGVALSALFMLICAIGTLIFYKWIPVIFLEDAQVITIAAQLLLIVAAFQFFDGVYITAMGALKGLADVRMPTFFVFLSFWVLGFPVAYLCGIYFGFKGAGVWSGLMVAVITCSILMLTRFRKLCKLFIKAS